MKIDRRSLMGKLAVLLLFLSLLVAAIYWKVASTRTSDVSASSVDVTDDNDLLLTHERLSHPTAGRSR